MSSGQDVTCQPGVKHLLSTVLWHAYNIFLQKSKAFGAQPNENSHQFGHGWPVPHCTGLDLGAVFCRRFS